jgi:hypothetical protein
MLKQDVKSAQEFEKVNYKLDEIKTKLLNWNCTIDSYAKSEDSKLTQD